jgi:hypothetical protein
VVRCPDGHYRRVVYGIGPYIADYPEQVWLACIVQNWCPKYVLHFAFTLYADSQNRCDAKPSNLDDSNARLRTHEKTDFIIKCFDPGIVWREHGIRSDVVVCCFTVWICSLTHRSKPFTYNFPRANIHELLSPDLLHQLIKGTFKDHIVSWVNEYIEQTYPGQPGLDIIQEIDRR